MPCFFLNFVRKSGGKKGDSKTSIEAYKAMFTVMEEYNKREVQNEGPSFYWFFGHIRQYGDIE
jgi:hypothetical protein